VEQEIEDVIAILFMNVYKIYLKTLLKIEIDADADADAGVTIGAAVTIM